MAVSSGPRNGMGIRKHWPVDLLLGPFSKKTSVLGWGLGLMSKNVCSTCVQWWACGIKKKQTGTMLSKDLLFVIRRPLWLLLCNMHYLWPIQCKLLLFAFWEGRQEKESLTQQFCTSLNEMEMGGQGRKKCWETIQIERNKRKEKSVAICPGWSGHSTCSGENPVP